MPLVLRWQDSLEKFLKMLISIRVPLEVKTENMTNNTAIRNQIIILIITMW